MEQQQDMSQQQQQQGDSPPGDEGENVESQQKDGFEESSESPVGHIFPNSGGNSDSQPDELAAAISNEENNGDVPGSSRSKVEKAHHKVVKSHLAKLHQTKADKKQEISARCLTCANSCPTDCYDSHHFGGVGSGVGIGGYGAVGGYGGVGHVGVGGYGGYSGGYGYGGLGGGHGVTIGAGFNGYENGGSYGHHGYVGNLGGCGDYGTGNCGQHHEAVVHRPDIVVPQPPDVVHRPDIVIHRKPIIIHRRPVIYHQNPVVVHKPPVVVHQSPIYVHPVVHHHRIITHHVHDYHIEPQVHHSGCECTGKRDCLCDPNGNSNGGEEKRGHIEGKLSKTDSHKKQEIASRCLDCGNNCDADCPTISPVGGYLGGEGPASCVDQVPLTNCETRKDAQMFKRPDIVVPQPPDIIHRPDIVIHRAPIVIHRRPVVYHQSPIVVHKPPVVVHQAPIIVHPVVHHHRVVTHHVHDYHIMPHHQETGCSCAGKKDCVCGDPNKEIQLPDSETAPTEDAPTEEAPTEEVSATGGSDKAAEVNVRSGIPKPEIVKKTTIEKEEDYTQTKKKKKDVVVSRPPIIYHPPPEIYHRPDIVVHRPPLLIHRPSIIYHQPPVIVHRPAVVYHQPPLIFHQPPPAVQQPLLVSHDSFRVRPSATYTHMGSVVNKVGSYVGIPHGPISNYPESRFYNERGYGPAPDNGYRGFGNEHLSYAGPAIESHGLGDELGHGINGLVDHTPLEGFGARGAVEDLVHAPENFAPQGGFAGEHVPLGLNGHSAEDFGGHSLPVGFRHEPSFGTHGSFEGFGAPRRVEGFGHYGLGHRAFDEFGGHVAQSGFAHVTPETYPTAIHGSGFGGFGHGADGGIVNNFARAPLRESMASRREMLPEGFEPAGQNNPAGGLGFPPEGTSHT